MLNHLFQPRVHVFISAIRENFISDRGARCIGASSVFQLSGLYIKTKLFNFDVFTLFSAMHLGIAPYFIGFTTKKTKNK